MIGEALGMADEAEELIAEADDTVAQIAADHPEFEGLTFAYTSMGAEALYLYLPTDPRVQLIEDLGFTVAPSVDELGADAETTFYVQLALESAPEIVSDVLVGFADGLSAEEVTALPIYTQVPAIQNDAAVLSTTSPSAPPSARSACCHCRSRWTSWSTSWPRPPQNAAG